MPLNPAQLHHMLREYNPGRACPADWNPSPDEAEAALRTTDILESFDNHPPLILPSNTFHLELGKPITEPALFEQLGHLQDFIRSLPTSQTTQQALSGTATDAKSATSRSSPSVTVVVPDPVPCPSLRAEVDSLSPAAPPQARGSHGDLSCSLAEAELTHKLKSLELQNTLPRSSQADLGCHKSLALDPSCLLTPPNTPQGMELSQSELEADLQEGAARQHRKGSCPRECSERRNGNVEEEEEKEGDEVFTVELHRGPHGLGLALVDGMKTPLKMTGIYIKSVVPESPAAQCQKLRLGDRILAVNGISLVGMEYHIGRELIRSSGDALRLLVAKNESKSTGKCSVITC
nr:ras-associating and dilute domain-containing protein-like isoform X2 [Oncorhynchus nerka]